MRSIPSLSRLVVAALLGLFGCVPNPVDGTALVDDRSANQAPADARPAKPLTLASPAVPSSDDRGRDLSKVDGDELASLARRLASAGNPREAARFQTWAVRSGVGGQYNLACWTALAGDLDGAFYWLQEAALDDGVEASWAGQDPDLASLHKDPRWKQVAPFLKRCNAYWAASGHRQVVLVLPEGYRQGTPIGVLVGMHGLGHRPDGFLDEDLYQAFADELNMAIVGVSGTVSIGRRSFVWSEDPSADARQVRQALDGLSDRLTVKHGHVIAFGFSQGAQMGFEVAFRNPDEFRGAIVMSPGANNRFFRLNKLTPSPGNKDQAYVCLCGAGEAPGNVGFARGDAQFARDAGARVELKFYEGMDKHAFPPDFAGSFVRWVRLIDGSGSEAKLE
jgi:predicted esterase